MSKLLAVVLFGAFFSSCASTSVETIVNKSVLVVPPNIRIRYEVGMVNDAELMKKLIEKSCACLAVWLGQKTFDEANQYIPFEISLLSRPTNDVNEKRALTQSGTMNGKLSTYFANLQILAKSSFKSAGYTFTGDPYDDNYLLKVLTHEYSQTLFDVVRRSHPSGWKMSEAPDWFAEGIAERTAVKCQPGHLSSEKMNKYLSVAANQVSGNHENPYVIGATSVEYLARIYGDEKVIGFLMSDLKFEEAFERSFGVSTNSFQRQFRNWVVQFNNPAM